MRADAFTVMLSVMWLALGALVLFSVYVIKHIDMYKKTEGPSVPYQDMQILVKKITDEASSSMKAQIFMELMEDGYVLIHKQENEGNKYNDQKQEKRFERALSDEVIAGLNHMRGKELC